MIGACDADKEGGDVVVVSEEIFRLEIGLVLVVSAGLVSEKRTNCN